MGWDVKDVRCEEEEEDNYYYEMDALTRGNRVRGCFPLPASSNNQICFIVSDTKLVKEDVERDSYDVKCDEDKQDKYSFQLYSLIFVAWITG